MAAMRPWFGLVLCVLVLAGLTTAGPAGAATFVVDNTNDSGPGSLRAAIVAANATPAADTIRFSLSGSPPFDIALESRLPTITAPLVINGESQADYAGQPLIELSNNTENSTMPGLEITAGASKVLGLSIAGFGTGIRLADGDGNTIAADWLGQPLVAGSSGNGDGVLIENASANNIVGGTSAATRNAIGFNGVGVLIRDAGTTGNIVQGNYIGTTDTGTGTGSNGTGVFVSGGATGNRIGGTSAASRNVIAANSFGVSIFGAGTSANVVEGNYVGLDANGAAGNGNEDDGIAISGGATANVVGGTTAGARNVISGNGTAGVRLLGSGTKTNVVEGNWIGTDTTGGAAAGGQTFGVIVSGGASANTVGGSSAGARNVISGNSRGVWVQLAGTKQNVVSGNWVGLDAAGGSPVPNLTDGILVSVGATANVVGGTTAGARNVVSGNAQTQISIADPGTKANVVEGNYVGTNPAGTAPLAPVQAGLSSVPGSNGIVVTNGATQNVVGGTTAGARNVASGNGGVGIYLHSDGNLVEGNYVGTNSTATAGLSNAAGGVVVDASNNTIGGTAAGARNVISANGFYEILLAAPGGSNLVAGNYVGTNATGKGAVTPGSASPGAGVFLSGSSDNTIGGTAVAARNVVANEPNAGIQVSGGSGNAVEGNFVGLGVDGAALPNGVGVHVTGGATTNTVGGTAAGAGNVISGNGGAGVLVEGSDTTGNVVAGNHIGTNPAGNAARPNNGPGVLLTGSASGNTVGGTTATAGNTIWFNTGDGVRVDGTDGTIAGGTIERNSIWSNGLLGIELAGDANGDIPAPFVDSVTTAGGTTKIKVSLGANAAIFRVEVFVSPSCDASGAGEGKLFLGAKTVDANQTSSTTFSVPALGAGQAVTATETDLNNGDTSEFSSCFTTP